MLPISERKKKKRSKLPLASSHVAIGELPFQRIALAAGVESLGLQDVQVRLLLARA